MYSKFRGELLNNIDRISIGRGTGYDVRKWRFPLTTVCPEPICRRQCRSRELAIRHYKINHADTSVLCTVCENPYSVDLFALHFTDSHPGYYLPIQTPRVTNGTSSMPRHSAQKQSDEGYSIMLSDGNMWAFPRITWCPHRGCSKNYENRKGAMNHYVIQHAPNMVLCTLCEPQKPITSSVIPAHYATVHPGAQLSPDWKDQIKKKCEVCHQILSNQRCYLQHKAIRHHIGKYKCPHHECDHTESKRFGIDTHWDKRHAHTSMKNLIGLRKFQPFKSDRKKQVWPSQVMKRKRPYRGTRSTTESSVVSSTNESDSAMKTQSNVTGSETSHDNSRRYRATRKNLKQKNKRISIIDDPKLFLRTSVQLTRLSHGKWTVQSNVPTAAPAPTEENVHPLQTAKEKEPLKSSEPKAGTSRNSVFIKTELPDYLEDVTFIHDDDDVVDLTESEDDDDVIFICG